MIFSMRSLDCLAKDQMKGPPKSQPTITSEDYGTGHNFLLNAYQNWISPVKGGNTCPMHPACSQYSKISFKIFPWYKAYIISLERLLRCGNELYLYPTIRIHGQTHWYDPVNDHNSNHENKNNSHNN
jgi:putative component of membrane protein insertase Oxa1/YidC/SpoIIIJ protein YidD